MHYFPIKIMLALIMWRGQLWPRVPRRAFGFPSGLNVSSPGPAGLPVQADHRGEHRQDQGGVQLPAGPVQQVRTGWRWGAANNDLFKQICQTPGKNLELFRAYFRTNSLDRGTLARFSPQQMHCPPERKKLPCFPNGRAGVGLCK